MSRKTTSHLLQKGGCEVAKMQVSVFYNHPYLVMNGFTYLKTI